MDGHKSFKWLSGSAYIPVPNYDHDEQNVGISYKDEHTQATGQARPPGSSSRPGRNQVTTRPGFFGAISGFLVPPKISGLLILSITCVLGFVVALFAPSSHHEHPSPQNTLKQHPHEKAQHQEHGRPHQIPHEAQCGSTPMEAKARNCIFEQQLGAWVPPACAWQEIVDEFLEVVGDMHVEWPWFWDSELKREVPAADIPRLQSGNFSVIFTTFPRSHELHCLYCWRKVEYAIEHGIEWMDARCHQFWHTKHCVTLLAQTLTDQAEQHRGLTYPLLYHDCVPLTSTKES